MLRATLRSLLAHKVRLLLTTVAVVLGVAFVAGSLVFTDTLTKTFNELFTQTSADVSVTPQTALGDDTQNGGPPSGAASLPASVLATVSSVEGVDRAVGVVFADGVQVVGKDGKTIGSGQAPSFGSSWSGDPDLSPFRLTDGRGPSATGEVAMDSETATKGGFSVGSTVHLVTPQGAREATLVGIFRYGTTGNLAGASITTMDLRSAQQLLLDGKDAFTSVDAKASAGVAQTTLKSRVQLALAPLGGTVKVQTGAEAADQAAKSITDGLKFFSIFLLVFAGIALVVGSFLILNTFSMIVAQRTRELALLRAIGASRRQVTTSVLGEALFVGVLGSTLGLAVGILLSIGLRALFKVLGADLPRGSLVVSGGTILVSYLVGVLVTLVAAYFPARRAARIAPVAAMRTDVTPAPRSLRLRGVLGASVIALGLLAVAGGLVGAASDTTSDGSHAALAGLGSVLVLIGVIVVSPSITGRVLGVLRAPFRATAGATGRIALENARRNPRRTASTASALMIGLTLVSAIGVLASSWTASTDAVISSAIRADFVAYTSTFQGFTPAVAKDIAATPGVAIVSPVQSAPARIAGSVTAVNGIDPSTIDQVLSLSVVSGSVQALSAGGLMVDDKTATANHWTVGSAVPVTFASGPTTLAVVGIYTANGAFSGPVVAGSTLLAHSGQSLDQVLYIKLAPGADATAVRTSIDTAITPYPSIQVKDQTEFKQQIHDQINQLLAVVILLLALAVLIAVLGVVNTLALSVIERTREIGLLRALGTSRRQLRLMVSLESVAISVFGAVLGVVLGLGIGIALQRALAGQGLTVLGVPWALVISVLVLSVLVGLFAAVFPAVRASRLNVLRAIATD
jgi:putative ABC transport system permease protein